MRSTLFCSACRRRFTVLPLYLLYWYKSTGVVCNDALDAPTAALAGGGSEFLTLLALLVQKYLLCLVVCHV
jgi:hypothetical protein